MIFEAALAQLFEYRFFYGSPEDTFCLLINEPISDARARFVELLEVAILLVRNDDDQDIRHHHRAYERPELDEGAAPAEEVGEAPGERDQEDEADERQVCVVMAEG